MAMAERELKRRTVPQRRAPEPTEEEVPQSSETGERLKAEIDDVLEDNAEEFVRNYVQKGGQ